MHWFKVWFAVVLLKLGEECTNADILVKNKDGTTWSVFSEYVVNTMPLIAEEQETIELEALLLDPTDYAKFCETRGHTDLTHKYGGKLVVVESGSHFFCEGELGNVKTYQYIVPFCLNVSSFFLELHRISEPGVLANENDGSRFTRHKEQHPSLSNCIFMGTAYPDGFDKSVIRERLLNESDRTVFLVSLDENLALQLYNSWWVTLFRWTLSFCFFVAFSAAIRILWVRYRLGILKPIFVTVLGLNAAVSIILGVFFLGGAHYSKPTWSTTANIFMFPVLFGTTTAQNVLLCSLFHEVASASKARSLNSRRSWLDKPWLLYGSAFCLITSDVIIPALSFDMADDVLLRFITAGSTILIAIQIAVSGFQVYQTRQVRHALKIFLPDPAGKAAKDQRSVQTASLINRISSFVMLSVCGDAVSVVTMALSPLMFANRWVMLLNSLFAYSARLTVIVAQLLCCEVRVSAGPRAISPAKCEPKVSS